MAEDAFHVGPSIRQVTGLGSPGLQTTGTGTRPFAGPKTTVRVRVVNAACLRSCLAIEGKEKGRNHANSGTGSIRVGFYGSARPLGTAC